jgi:hypothetical protein
MASKKVEGPAGASGKAQKLRAESSIGALNTKTPQRSKALLRAMRRSLAQARSPELRERLALALASLVKEGG